MKNTLRKHEHKLKLARDAAVAIITQLLHINHIMHGMCPETMIKADAMMTYARILWDHHDFRDMLEGEVKQGLTLTRNGECEPLTGREAKAVAAALDKISPQSNSDEVAPTISGDEKIEQINHDYQIVEKAIESLSNNCDDEVIDSEMKEVCSHAYSDDGKTMLPEANEEETIKALKSEADRARIRIQEEIDHEKRVRNVMKAMKATKDRHDAAGVGR